MVIAWMMYKMTSFKTRSLKYKGKEMTAYLADTPSRQLVGLMYRKKLEKNSGMLFIFRRDERWGIWMANMRFPIDILWLDKDGKIVAIKKNAQPSKSAFTSEVYKPARLSRYVLELNSGDSERYKMNVGDKLPI